MPTFGPLDARLLIVGLAPGLRGANRTGRPFTGDYAGDLLYATLSRFRLRPRHVSTRGRTTGCDWSTAAITNAVRCVPPENKPTPAEINTCRDFSRATIAAMPKLRGDRWRSAASPMTAPSLRSAAQKSAAPFGHGAATQLARSHAVSSYHCSRYNTNTGVLTPEMFREVFASVRTYLDG